MNYKKPDLKKYFKLPNPGLLAYFKRTEDGNPDDYRPPFFKGKSRDTVSSDWLKVIDSLGVQDKYPELYAFEMDMKEHIGPMSIQLPLQERLKDVELYYTEIQKESVPIDNLAVKAAIKFFSRAGGIRFRSVEKTVNSMRLSTNGGNPDFIKRSVMWKRYKRAIMKAINEYGILVPEAVFNYVFELVAILGWRGQEGGLSFEDVKQRVIWMMAFLLNIAELQFYQPAIEAIQKNGCIPAYVSMDAVDREVTALFDTKGKDDLVICTDFSKFDQHFNKDMQNAALQIEKALAQKSAASDWYFREIFPKKFNLPLICSENVMYTGPHGMGSGSGGTNFDECMAHKALQFEAAIKNNAKLNPHSMAYGDDGILTYPDITVEQVIQAYTSHGQEMNPSKQYVSKHDCVVLRRWHGMDYRVNGTMVGVYSTFRALGRLLAQERFYDPEKWSAEMVELRALSILENCKWSPYFKEFIDFVMTGDKYRLGLDLPGFLDNLERKAKEAMEEFTDFLGYTKNLQENGEADAAKGINNWEVVKYLKSLRDKA